MSRPVSPRFEPDEVEHLLDPLAGDPRGTCGDPQRRPAGPPGMEHVRAGQRADVPQRVAQLRRAWASLTGENPPQQDNPSRPPAAPRMARGQGPPAARPCGPPHRSFHGLLERLATLCVTGSGSPEPRSPCPCWPNRPAP